MDMDTVMETDMDTYTDMDTDKVTELEYLLLSILCHSHNSAVWITGVTYTASSKDALNF